jgi:Na+/H+ antiporter NhaD/arsenite permease-like protein
MILGIVSILSGLIVNTPVAIIFNPIIEFLILEYGLEKDHILFAYIMGINISSNFLPHGAVSDMMILKTAKDNDVKNISYRRLFKYGSIFALIHTLLAIGYIYLLIHFL